MKKINKPTYQVKEVFSICIETIRNRSLKKRLEACTDLIGVASKEFESKISEGQIHTINKETVVNGNVTSEELKNIYTDKMLKGIPRTDFYDKLRSAPSHGICPLCSHRLVEALDHYLPKADFPRLTIAPINLIPSCNACNKSKGTKSPSEPKEATLHPYYDDIENDSWLIAHVNQTTPPSLKYSVNPPEKWTKLLSERVLYHFDAFCLNSLYATQAAVQFSNIAYRLGKIHSSAGTKEVKIHLQEEANSRNHADKNSWQTAMYKALAIDEWYCNGGFKME